jgi:hypothetical protein
VVAAFALPAAGAPPAPAGGGGLLTVWPGLGQHGPGARRFPQPRTAVESDTCGPGGTMPPGLEPQGPDPYPPEDRGPALEPSRAGPMAGRGIREVPGGGLHAGRPGGQDGHGPQDPRTAKAAGPAAPGPGRPARGCAPGQRRPGDAVRLWPAALFGLPLGLDLCWPGEESGTVGRSLVFCRVWCYLRDRVGTPPFLGICGMAACPWGSCDD